MKKAIFLDKDGTLIPDIPYNVNPDLITFESNIIEGLKKLQDAGYLLLIISNQAGVARGYFTEDKLLNVELKMKQLFIEQGLVLSAFYYCPHHPEGLVPGYDKQCNCRKPAPGMFIQASNEHNIDLQASWMIGDILNDVEAGNRAGCKTVLIDNGNETEWFEGEHRRPALICNSINAAAEQILELNTDALAGL